MTSKQFNLIKRLANKINTVYLYDKIDGSKSLYTYIYVNETNFDGEYLNIETSIYNNRGKKIMCNLRLHRKDIRSIWYFKKPKESEIECAQP